MMTLDLIYQVLAKTTIVVSALVVFVLGLFKINLRGSKLSVMFCLFLSSFLLVTNASVIIEEEITDVIEKVEYVIDVESVYRKGETNQDGVYSVDLDFVEIPNLFRYQKSFVLLFKQPLYILYCRLMVDQYFAN